MSKYYILLETENTNATFIQKVKGDFRFFEIFHFSGDVIFIDKLYPEALSDIIVVASSQEEALKKFGKKFPNLMKRSLKKFYEADLIL